MIGSSTWWQMTAEPVLGCERGIATTVVLRRADVTANTLRSGVSGATVSRCSGGEPASSRLALSTDLDSWATLCWHGLIGVQVLVALTV